MQCKNTAEKSGMSFVGFSESKLLVNEYKQSNFHGASELSPALSEDSGQDTA